MFKSFYDRTSCFSGAAGTFGEWLDQLPFEESAQKMEYGRLLCPVRARLFFTFLPAYARLLENWREPVRICLRCQSGFRETGVVPHDGITLAPADRRHGGETL